MGKVVAGLLLTGIVATPAAEWHSTLVVPRVQDSLSIYETEVNPLTGALLGPSRRLLTDLPNSWLPQYSKDGRRLAYLSTASSGRAMLIVRQPRPVLSVRTLDTGQTTSLQLAFSQVFSYDWSPDGRTFVMRATDMNGGGYGIHRVDATTGNVTPLGIGEPNGVRYLNPSWADDSRHIYYVKGKPGVLGEPLMVRDLETDEERVFLDWTEVRTAEGAALAGLRDQRVSPDRQRVAVWATAGFSSGVLWLVSLETKAARELLRVDGNPVPLAGAAISWTANGRALLVNRPGSPGTNGQSLLLVPIDGSRPVTLAVDLSIQNLPAAVHPDGRRVAFVSGVQ